MTHPEIRFQDWWEYIGIGDGRGIPHIITHFDGKEVITWSDLNHPGSGGFTWEGPKEAFLRNFIFRHPNRLKK